MGAPPLRLGLCGLLLLASTPRSHPAAGGSNTADGPHPSSPVGTTPHLRWFSAYDVPAAQCANVSGWMNLHQGDSAEDAALCAKHGVRTLWSVEKLFFNSSVLGHKGCAKVPGGCLVRDWRQAWEKLLPVVTPLVADKTIAVSAAAPSASPTEKPQEAAAGAQGFNLGDELICHTLSYSNLSVAADTIRGAFPDALIWWNECGHTVAEPKNPAWEGQTKIPASVSWMSIDFPCERRVPSSRHLEPTPSPLRAQTSLRRLQTPRSRYGTTPTSRSPRPACSGPTWSNGSTPSSTITRA